MSAVVWEGRSGYAAPAPSGRRPGRAGEPARREHRSHLVLVPSGAAATGGGLRLTRRGRLALAALFVVLAIAVGGFAISGPSVPAPVTHTVTVRPGQTLSGLAATELPGLSLGEAMAAIRVANQLNTTTITAGQTLVIPQT